jgi:hypothetical protein
MLNLAWKGESRALEVLEKMVRVTMMRGAQSGGRVVTRSGLHSRTPALPHSRESGCFRGRYRLSSVS